MSDAPVRLRVPVSRVQAVVAALTRASDAGGRAADVSKLERAPDRVRVASSPAGPLYAGRKTFLPKLRGASPRQRRVFSPFSATTTQLPPEVSALYVLTRTYERRKKKRNC